MEDNAKSKIKILGIGKKIYCILLTAILIVQTSTATMGGSQNDNLNSYSAQSEDSKEVYLKELCDRIVKLNAVTAEEDANVLINEHELKLNIGETFELQLKKLDGQKVENVEWFVLERVPEYKLYTAESFNKKEGTCVTITDGLVVAKDKGISDRNQDQVEIWAKWENHLYKCTVEVEKKKETELKEKVEEIADKFRYISSDVDKVMAVHDYILDNVTYDISYIVSYAYGALIKGRAVCQGYAQSFQKIIDSLNIEGETLKGYSKTSGEFHQWNKVKLDDGWYFIDSTWDDAGDSLYKIYKYFLVNDDMLSNDHIRYRHGNKNDYGSKYIYYAYEKKGLLAHNKDELKKVIENQFNENNNTNIILAAAVPKPMGEGEVQAAIKEIAGKNVYLNEITAVRDTFGTYQFFAYDVSNIRRVQQKNITLLDIEPINEENETTKAIRLKFSDNISDLSLRNISIDGVNKTQLRKIDEKTYELDIDNSTCRESKSVTVVVNKRGLNILDNAKEVDITIVKEDKPNVEFIATGRRSGILENVEEGMKYDLGDGKWKEIISSDPVPIETKYLEHILIYKSSSKSGILDSDVQKILPRESREPQNIKGVDSTGTEDNGKIIYVNRKMEYQKQGDDNWKSCEGNEVTGLAPGKYSIRYKADGIKLASETITVLINAVPGESGKEVVPPEDGNKGKSESGTGGEATKPEDGEGLENSDSKESGKEVTPPENRKKEPDKNRESSKKEDESAGKNDSKESGKEVTPPEDENKGKSESGTGGEATKPEDGEGLENSDSKESGKEVTPPENGKKEPDKNGESSKKEDESAGKNNSKENGKEVTPPEDENKGKTAGTEKKDNNDNSSKGKFEKDTHTKPNKSEKVENKKKSSDESGNSSKKAEGKSNVESSNSSNTSSGGGGGGATIKTEKLEKDLKEKGSTNKENVGEPKNTAKKEELLHDKNQVVEVKVADIMTKFEAKKVVANLSDIKDITWSRSYIEKVIQKGIMTGDEHGNFMPRKNATRAEVAQVITNILGKKAATNVTISDVDSSKWYHDAVQTVLENKIFTKDSRGNFYPENKITRAELFTVIARLKSLAPLGDNRADEVLKIYYDINEIPAWSKGYIAALVEKGIVKGSNHRINARTNLTREELATILATIVDTSVIIRNDK